MTTALTNRNTGNNPLPSISTITPPPPTVSSLPLFKAIYPFTSQEGGEVSFEKGDTMEIVEKDENGKTDSSV
jgi:myosin-1